MHGGRSQAHRGIYRMNRARLGFGSPYAELGFVGMSGVSLQG